jgi:hypothetical protein
MKVVNASKQRLAFPDGIELLPGQEREMASDQLENAGIKSWIEDGWLEIDAAFVEADTAAKAEASAQKPKVTK